MLKKLILTKFNKTFFNQSYFICIMQREKSVGAIIYEKEDDKIKFLILYKIANDKYKESWDFSRGNIEKEEDEKQTAVREIKEETGINDLKFIEGFRERTNFVYKKQGNLIFKEIIYLLAETKKKEVVLSFEHNNYLWLDFNEAFNKITFKNTKDVLKLANDFLIKREKEGLNRFL